MQTTKPFPGMNPFLEGSWPNVHTRLIGYISDAMDNELPQDLSARAEEEVFVGRDSDESPAHYRADVAVTEVWPPEFPEVWRPDSASESDVAVAEPEIIVLDHPTHRWVEIRDLDVPFDLQPLIDRVYRTGRYWQINRREIPGPPLPAEDVAWAEDRLRDAGLR